MARLLFTVVVVLSSFKPLSACVKYLRIKWGFYDHFIRKLSKHKYSNWLSCLTERRENEQLSLDV